MLNKHKQPSCATNDLRKNYKVQQHFFSSTAHLHAAVVNFIPVLHSDLIDKTIRVLDDKLNFLPTCYVSV